MHVIMVIFTYLATSVTRFDEISPLGQNFKSLWLFYEG